MYVTFCGFTFTLEQIFLVQHLSFWGEEPQAGKDIDIYTSAGKQRHRGHWRVAPRTTQIYVEKRPSAGSQAHGLLTHFIHYTFPRERRSNADRLMETECLY